MLITPAGRGKGSNKNKDRSHPEDKTPTERHAAMTWAQRLKRVFDIDIEICEKCQGPVRIVACVEDPAVIRQILEHLRKKDPIDPQAQPRQKAGRPALGPVKVGAELSEE